MGFVGSANKSRNQSAGSDRLQMGGSHHPIFKMHFGTLDWSIVRGARQ